MKYKPVWVSGVFVCPVWTWSKWNYDTTYIGH